MNLFSYRLITIFLISILVSEISYTQSISGGSRHTLFLCDNNTIKVWGANDYGQLGNGTLTNSNVPIDVVSLSNVTSVNGAGDHSIALLNNGTVWTWGWNVNGELGNGTTTNSSIPVQVNSITNVLAISGEVNHSLALKNDGTVWGWGKNNFGQLGNGTLSNSLVPTQMSSINNVASLDAGNSHSLVLKNDGTVWACGYNLYGQLGNGTTNNSNTPVQVPSLSNVIAISGGTLHSLALKADGTVWAWGYNLYGQLGNGSNTDSQLAIQVMSLNNIIAITASGHSSYALKSDGTVWAWGFNLYGQLGNGNNTDSNIPVQVTGLNNVNALNSGVTHVIATKNDGSVWLWGRNALGQLGNGSNLDSNVPLTLTGMCLPFLPCSTSYHSISAIECSSYISPSGDIHTISEIFNDTIPNAAGCDSVITINLTILNSSSSTISPTACGSYTAPDGTVHTTSGIFSSVIPNAAGCDSTITVNLTVNPYPTVDAGTDQTVCDGTSVTLTGTGAVVYTWDNSIVNGGSFIPPVGINEYVISGMSVLGCFDTDTVIVTVNSLPTVSFTIDKTSGCAPLVFNLTNTTLNSINCFWDISNGADLNGCGTVTGVLNQIGCHDITLTTTDNNGCTNSYTATNIICVQALPNASFSASANSFSQSGEQIVFTNSSSGASSYSWNFGDSSPISTIENPTHIYQDGVQASYVVELISFSDYGCSDTAYLTIFNTPNSDTIDSEIFIPTGFSPNNDGENDSWTITGLEKYPKAVIQVFNRWGQLLFDGGPSNPSWDGYFQGKLLPTADYYFIVDLGTDEKINGVVTLKQ
jgi:gliding motility-associated-like protein